MRESLIEAGLYVTVNGNIGVISGRSSDSEVDTRYAVEFKAHNPANGTITWWCTADEMEQVRGV